MHEFLKANYTLIDICVLSLKINFLVSDYNVNLQLPSYSSKQQMAGTLFALEIENFKSFKDKHYIGPFKQFSAIVRFFKFKF